MEQKLISAVILDREIYEEVVTLKLEEDLSDQAKIIFKVVEQYYQNDPEIGRADVEILQSIINRQYPKHAELFSTFLSGLDPVSPANVLEEVIALKLESVKHKLAQELIGTTNKKTEAKVEDLIDRYHSLKEGELLNASEEGAGTEIYQAPKVADILSNDSASNRIAILPLSLNKQLNGGVLRGHHVVVFAPTDMGKSLFCLNMAYGFLKQGLKVLMCGNEDPANDMIFRLLWRLTGRTREEIQADTDKAQELAEAKGYNNFTFAEVAPGTPWEIEELIKEYEPDVLIVDQIRNLDMGDTNKVTSLEKAASFMRKVGKKYNLVPISITQAGDSATGKSYLSRGDIDFSNVGIPGTADLLLGIGATEEMERGGERMISFVKNKISGNKIPLKVWFNQYLTRVE